MTSFFEIVELPNGDVSLRRADEDGEGEEPIVTIQFSEEAKESLKTFHVDVARAMLEAGIRKVSELSGVEVENAEYSEHFSDSSRVH